jgi:hypothetical protein
MQLDVTMRCRAFLGAGVFLCIMAAPTADGEKSAADRSLVLHYVLDRDPGAAVKDLSAHGNDGKIVKAKYLDEVNGRKGVLRFDGESSWIDIADSESLHVSGDLSLEMWMRINGPVKSLQAILFTDPGSLLFGVVDLHSLVLDYTWGRNMQIPVERNILSDRWSHIAMVVQYPRCRFYCNGELVQDAYMPIPGISSTGNAKRIGQGCPMDLSEFRLYRRALTAEEVAAHAKGQEAPVSGTEELAVDPNWYEKQVALRLEGKGRDYSGQVVEMTIQKGDYTNALAPQKVRLKEAFKGCGRYVGTVNFPLTGLENQSLDAVARLLGPDGQVVKTVYRHTFMKKPDWIQTNDGYSDEVLPPWTPLVAERKDDGTVEVGVWGRTQVFGKTLFPQKIESGGTQLLTGPITLTGHANGKEMRWEEGRSQLKESGKTAASLAQAAENDLAAVKVNTSVEYDGYMIYDCELKAKRDLALTNLQLDIPLQSKCATLCYGDRVHPPNDQIPIAEWYSGAVKGDLALRFSPCIWLGNEERGLCWQADSDEEWNYSDPQKAIEILPRGETTTFRVHLVNVPTQLKQGQALHYKFALQATPIKPMLRDAWDFRIARYDPYGEEMALPDLKTDGKPTLQYYADLGIRHLMIWASDIWNYPMPVHPKFSIALHRLINAAHGQGLRLDPYEIAAWISVAAPEFDLYGLQMAKFPFRPFQIGPPQYGDPALAAVILGPDRPIYHGAIATNYGANSQANVEFCAKSRLLQDAYIHALAQRLDQYGDDGVYLDGTVQMNPCQNMGHGCGYRAKDGSIHSTYAAFETREFMKRIYTVVKQRRPDGIVDAHCSYGYNPAGLAYADIFWTGEQWWQLRETGGVKYVAGELTLDRFKTEFMGYPIGVPGELLAYRLGSKIKVEATSLLYDVPIRIFTGDTEQIARMVKLWKMREQFGAKEAEKLFYWMNQDYVTVTPEKCYATLFKHPKNGVLAFISNLRRDAQTVTVQFNLEKLNLRDRKLGVFNALTNEPVAMTADGKLSVSLGSEEWLYLWLKPADVAVGAN